MNLKCLFHTGLLLMTMQILSIGRQNNLCIEYFNSFPQILLDPNQDS